MMLLRATLAPNGRRNGHLVGPTATQWFELTDAGWGELSQEEATRLLPIFQAFTWETRHEGAARLRGQLERAMAIGFPHDSQHRTVEMITGGTGGPDITFWMTFPPQVTLDFDLVKSLPTIPFQELPSHRLIEIELEPSPARWASASA